MKQNNKRFLTNEELLEKYQWVDDQQKLEEFYEAITSKEWCRAVVDSAGDNAVYLLKVFLSQALEQKGGGR